MNIVDSACVQAADTLAHFVSRHRRLLVLTGAGCSTASGLGTWRNREGEWACPPPMHGRPFRENPSTHRRYWLRSALGWPVLRRAAPNPAHTALAELEQLGLVPMLITQNVDRLHQQAGHREVMDLHGNLHQVRCLQCQRLHSREAIQAQLLSDNPWLSDRQARATADGDAAAEEADESSLQPPRCNACGGMLHPDVVFYGDSVPRLRVEAAMQALQDADALLVVGSSLMTYSGFRFCKRAAAAAQPIALLCDGLTRADDLATLKLTADCTRVLPAMLRRLRSDQ